MVGEVILGKPLAFRQIAARLAAGKGLLREPEDPMLGGLSVGQWFELFDETHAPNGMGALVRIEWPEPGGLAEQPAVVPLAMAMVAEARLREAESK